ncbi:MAG: DinB family protein [Chitinophagaceae bacterium]
MRITYLLLSLLFTTIVTAQKIDSIFLDAAITKLQNSKEYTLKVASLMPEEKYGFKPVQDEMSFGEQLLHISANLGWLTSSYITNSKSTVTKPATQVQKKEEIIQVLNKTYDFSITALKSFDASHLADTISFFAGPKTKLQIINLISDHQTHHRAQMIVYLRLNGIKPPEYTGW